MSPGSEMQKYSGLPIIRKQKQSRILLIESEASVRQIVSLLLDSQGYEVLLATDAAEVCRLMQDNRFAFILFDWFLPGETGTDFCKTVRAIDSQTPIYFYTGPAGNGGSEKSIEADAQPYSAQPISTDDLLKTIFLHIERLGKQAGV